MQNTLYTNTFLNSLFTAKEFEFINNLDNDIQKIDSMISKEEKNRDFIVTFINNLNDAMNNAKDADTSQFSKLLVEVQDIFELINSDIQTLYKIKEDFDEISNELMALLMKVQANENEIDVKKDFSLDISLLKDKFVDFSASLEKSKPIITLNNIKVDNFLQQNIVKKYLSSFSTDFDLTNAKKKAKPIVKENKKDVETPKNVEISKNIDIVENNDTLLISEKRKRVYLPYSKKEILEYLEQYPDQYISFEDVVKQEFIFPIDFYQKHPVIARFRETYSLIRDRESKSILEAFKLASNVMFQRDLNPSIIAACKNQEQLDDYLSCLSRKKTDEFTDFKIVFELNPLKV